jgi:uncharacterized protein (DUF4415 family)
MTKTLKISKEMQAKLDAAPAFNIQDIPELKDFKPGKAIRGFAAFKEHINRKGRPKSPEALQGVYMRLPRDTVAKLRAKGRGWQVIFRERLSEMIRLGMF